MRRMGRVPASCDPSLCCRTWAQKDTEDWILLNFHFMTMLKQEDRNIETTEKMLGEWNSIELFLQHLTDIHGEVQTAWS